MFAFTTEVLGRSDVSTDPADETGEREHTPSGAGNEADAGRNSRGKFCFSSDSSLLSGSRHMCPDSERMGWLSLCSNTLLLFRV